MYKKIKCAARAKGQLFKRSLKQSLKPHSKSFSVYLTLLCINTIYCEHFHESIWLRLEKHLFS